MATNRWIGASGDWSTPSDWSTDTVPSASDEAVIAATGSYTVTVTAPAAAGSVSLKDPGAILDIQSGGTLAVSGSLAVQSGTLETETLGTLTIGSFLDVQSGGTLFLDGGTIEGGSLIIRQGGALEVSEAIPIYHVGTSALQNVAVLGGLTLNGGTLALAGNTTIENSNGTGPGAITLNGSSTYLIFAEDYTLYNLTLNGGNVAGDLAGTGHAVTVGKGGLVQGYGEFIYGSYGYLALDNEGTINSNVNGQSLIMDQMPFTNDGLVLASAGGNISIDWDDSYAELGSDAFSNNADGVISVINGGTLQLGGNVTNSGLISSVNSTVYFGDGLTHLAQNAGDIAVLGGELLLSGVTNSGLISAMNSTVYFGDDGSPDFLQSSFLVSQNAGDIVLLGGELFLGVLATPYTPIPYQWIDAGLITTVGTAIDVQGSGDISAVGTLSVLGGSVSGQAALEDDGQIKLGGASMDVSSLTIGAGGELSGFGAIANPIGNSGIIDANACVALILAGGGPDTNAGLMEATLSGTLLIENVAIDNYLNATNGTVEAGNGSTVGLENATIAGGFVTVMQGAIIEAELGSNTIIGAVVTNAGTIGAEGANLTIIGNVTNTGTLDANNSTLVIDGAVSGGNATIEGTGQIEFGSASSANVTFAVNSDAILKLDEPLAFTGTVSGLSTGDYIDLTNINYADNPTISYAPNTHVLTVTDSVSQVTDTITFRGVTGSFSAQSDGNGGTLITDSPPPTNMVAEWRGQDTFVFAPNLGESPSVNFTVHSETIDPSRSEFTDFAALAAQSHQDEANAINIINLDHATALIAHHAHEFLV